MSFNLINPTSVTEWAIITFIGSALVTSSLYLLRFLWNTFKAIKVAYILTQNNLPRGSGGLKLMRASRMLLVAEERLNSSSTQKFNIGTDKSNHVEKAIDEFLRDHDLVNIYDERDTTMVEKRDTQLVSIVVLILKLLQRLHFIK